MRPLNSERLLNNVTKMENCITIAGHSARIELEIIKYEFNQATDNDSLNWLCAVARFKFGKISGSGEYFVQTFDLVRLYSELKNLHDSYVGNANLDTLEEGINIAIKPTTLGHVQVSGWIKSDDLVSTVVTFNFASDLSFLTETLSSLDEVIEKFPVRKIETERV